MANQSQNSPFKLSQFIFETFAHVLSAILIVLMTFISILGIACLVAAAILMVLMLILTVFIWIFWTSGWAIFNHLSEKYEWAEPIDRNAIFGPEAE